MSVGESVSPAGSPSVTFTGRCGGKQARTSALAEATGYKIDRVTKFDLNLGLGRVGVE